MTDAEIIAAFRSLISTRVDDDGQPYDVPDNALIERVMPPPHSRPDDDWDVTQPIMYRIGWETPNGLMSFGVLPDELESAA